MRLKIKKLFKNMDKPLFFVMLIIIVFGLLNIVTASSRETVVRYDQSLYHYFFQHSIMLIISFIGSLVIINVPTKSYVSKYQEQSRTLQIDGEPVENGVTWTGNTATYIVPDNNTSSIAEIQVILDSYMGAGRITTTE